MQIASTDVIKSGSQKYDGEPKINARKKALNGINFFDYLPDELLLYFTKYFTVKELGLFKAICKRFHQIANDASLIPILFRTRFPVLASFHKKQELTDEFYEKAIFNHRKMFDKTYFPKETVFRKKVNDAEGIHALACEKDVVYSSFFSKKKVAAWDLKGEAFQYFECSEIPHCIGASKDYFFCHGNLDELIRHNLSGTKTTTSRSYSKANFWHFKVIEEAIYARAEYGVIVVNPKTGKRTKYHGEASSPFFADQNQILGINYNSIISWDRETKKIKSELRLNQTKDPDLKLFLQAKAYFSEGNRIFLAANNASLVSYDLREEKMSTPLKIHQSLIYGIIFYNNELVTSSADQTFKIWDIRNFNSTNVTPIRSIHHDSYVTSLCCNKDSIFIGTRMGDIVKYNFFETEELIDIS